MAGDVVFNGIDCRENSHVLRPLGNTDYFQKQCFKLALVFTPEINICHENEDSGILNLVKPEQFHDLVAKKVDFFPVEALRDFDKENLIVQVGIKNAGRIVHFYRHAENFCYRGQE